MRSTADRCAFVAAMLFNLLLWPVGAVPAVAATGAQSYPVKPLRLVVPFPAGASSDIVGRMLGEKLAEQMGEQIVADNRPGAGGNVGIGFTAKSPPDGYTIVIATSSIAVSPSL